MNLFVFKIIFGLKNVIQADSTKILFSYPIQQTFIRCFLSDRRSAGGVRCGEPEE